MTSIPISIDNNGTTTLATAGKYCDRNIEINVNTQDRYEEGKQAEYDAFWDAFQGNGGRTAYYYGFSGTGWNKDTFQPKYQIVIVGNGEGIFRNFNYTNTNTDNLVDLSLLAQPVDWSKCTSLKDAFLNARIRDTGVINATGCAVLESTFVNKGKGCLIKITLKVKELTTYTTPIQNQTALTDLIFTEDSVIGNSGWNLSASTLLSKESIQSIINALSSTASGKSITLSTEAKTSNFTDDEWSALVATKSNWTIALA